MEWGHISFDFCLGSHRLSFAIHSIASRVRRETWDKRRTSRRRLSTHTNYTFPTQELIFESFALPSLENTIGTISPFLFAINHRKSCSKRHLKNIILLNIDLCACVCMCVRVCVLMNNKAIL